MENTSEEGAPRRKPWPSQDGIREAAGSGPVKRKYLSDRVAGPNKLEKPERIAIKALSEKMEDAYIRNMDDEEPGETFSSSEMDVQKIVDMVTPASKEQYYEIWKKTNRLSSMNEKSQEKFKTEFDKWIAMPENSIDFSEKTVSRIKNIVKSAIEESPKFKWAVKTFGFPIVVAKTDTAERAIVSQREGKQEDGSEQSGNIGVVSDAFLKSISFMPSAINSIYANGDAPDNTAMTSRSSLPKMGDAIMDPTINGQIRHEWSHHFIADALNDSERVDRVKTLKDKNNAALFKIAEKYMSDSTMMANLEKEFSETADMPRTITRYAHANMFEMFAEGMSAYLHPDTSFERFVMNATLRKDIETALGGSPGNKPWEEQGE
jgi:hypothetical protein